MRSWGGVSGETSSLAMPAFSSEIRANLIASADDGRTKLVVGNLRSYGDQVVSAGGHYVQTTRCDRVLALDAAAGIVTVESGVTLESLQRRVLPHGFIVPVTPGTALLTVGGAIANDVHGKNQRSAGTFGCHLVSFELARTDGAVLQCSPTENADWFAATIGGMGLTGAITRATLRLRWVPSPLLRVRSWRCANLAAFFSADREFAASHEYSVAWIDCLARGAALGRGVYSVADFLPADGVPRDGVPPEQGAGLRIPITPPVSPINRITLAAMNSLYFHTHALHERVIDFRRWLYPLDAIGDWNRLYGARGFRQFQCVVPAAVAPAAIPEMLATIARARDGSLLAVLKNFGDVPSPGLMSFPMPGTTLALDFPQRGPRTEALLLRLYDIAAAAGGRLYCAKDACSPPGSLERDYPNFARFKQFADPGLASLLTRRLRLTP